MAIRLERVGVEECIGKVNVAIEELKSAAKQIDESMNAIAQYWEGEAYNKARATYEEEYQNLLKNTVPDAVDNFNTYIEQCKNKIIEIDEMLSGN